jgi:hypothetical protein
MKYEVLLVEPDFPYPAKSKNKANGIHKNFVPVGLLKLGAYYKSLGSEVRLVRGNKSKRELEFDGPNLILVTSIFTYWSSYVWNAIKHYRILFPESRIILGGIYSTLHHNKEYFKQKLRNYDVECHYGLHIEAEKFYPDYSLLGSEVDHHVTHAMRGCIRRCKFCGVWKIEPTLHYKTSEELQKEIISIGKNRVIFFDNNFLANKNVEQILKMLNMLKVNGRPIIFESQSGFDGRLLENNPKVAALLKEARFHNVRIAWDNSFSDYPSIKKQIDYLVTAGYKAKDIYIFMIYDFDVPYDEMLKKLNYCKKLGVQISDCRYRPLESTEDNYNPAKFREGQTKEEYYIHTQTGWTDQKIRDFRKRVRQHNIWIRYAKDKGHSYDKRMERWSDIHNIYKFFKMGRPPGWEIIEKSNTLKNRITMMKRIKTYCKKNEIIYINLSCLYENKIDNELKKILDTISENGKQFQL